MSKLPLASAFLAGAVVAGLACGPALRAAPPSPAPAGSPLGVPGAEHERRLASVLIVDRSDLRLGTTAQFGHLPTAAEVNDLAFVRGLLRVVLVLDAWPENVGPLEPLARLPQGVELLVVLHGYPPSRAAADAWNQLDAAARLVVVADGPPPTGAVYDLNAMRGLERIVVDTEEPSRSGFERLQRPLGFRVLRD